LGGVVWKAVHGRDFMALKSLAWWLVIHVLISTVAVNSEPTQDTYAVFDYNFSKGDRLSGWRSLDPDGASYPEGKPKVYNGKSYIYCERCAFGFYYSMMDNDNSANNPPPMDVYNIELSALSKAVDSTCSAHAIVDIHYLGGDHSLDHVLTIANKGTTEWVRYVSKHNTTKTTLTSHTHT
jgi:hypothetical protein